MVAYRHVSSVFLIAFILLVVIGARVSTGQPKSGSQQERLDTFFRDVTESERKEARSVVEEIERDPGIYAQICSLSSLQPARIQPFAFERGEYHVSAENFERLRRKRIPVLAVLEENIRRSIDRKDRNATESAPNEFGSGLSSHDLVMLIDLNGVELLGRLWSLEEKTWSESSQSSSKIAKGQKESGDNLHLFVMNADEFDSQLLSTMTAIMRQERFQPLLDSDMETAYCAAVQEASKKYREDNADGKERIKPNPWYYYDPLCHEMIRFTPYCSFDFTKQQRDRIISWTKDFLKTVPPQKRRAAAGMSPWPIAR